MVMAVYTTLQDAMFPTAIGLLQIVISISTNSTVTASRVWTLHASYPTLAYEEEGHGAPRIRFEVNCGWTITLPVWEALLYALQYLIT